MPDGVLPESERLVGSRLQRAEGYVELGLLDEVADELREVVPPLPWPELTRRWWRISLEWHRRRGEWEAMRRMALACRDAWPEEPCWWVPLAYAIRRCPPDLSGCDPIPHPERLPTVEGWCVLRAAERRFPAEPTVLFNLADYCREMGRRYEAAAYLRRLLRLDGRWWAAVRADREMARLLTSLEPET